MKIEETSFKGLFILSPNVISDDRGQFMETYSKKLFNAKVLPLEFVQDNESYSKKNVLRGLHFQIPPKAQAKLVRVVHGSALDVVVDLRKGEPTCGKWFALELSEKNKLQMFIPEGFAHGFLSLEEDTVFSYKCSEFYSRDHEQSLLWNDTDLSITWGIESPLLSEKDKSAMLFSDFTSPF